MITSNINCGLDELPPDNNPYALVWEQIRII